MRTCSDRTKEISFQLKEGRFRLFVRGKVFLKTRRGPGWSEKLWMLQPGSVQGQAGLDLWPPSLVDGILTMVGGSELNDLQRLLQPMCFCDIQKPHFCVCENLSHLFLIVVPGVREGFKLAILRPSSFNKILIQFLNLELCMLS